MKRIVLFGYAFYFLTAVHAQQKINPDSIRNKMQWFQDAKLGIFIHWGLYSVKGIGESWSFHNKEISYADYMKHGDAKVDRRPPRPKRSKKGAK